LAFRIDTEKRILYEHIGNKESALCKNKKKYEGKKSKKLCDMDSDPPMENLSSYFSAEAARFLAAMFRNIDRGLTAGGGILMKKCWLCSSLYHFARIPPEGYE
jgi:hypothetical protein